MATTHQNDLRALEMTRQRLISLTNAISSLQRELMTSDPLPSWPSLTTSFTLLSHQLASLTTHLSTNAATLSSLHTYPLPIPAPAPAPTENRAPVWHAQEAMLTQLLRKKLDPDAESWVQAGLERATASIAESADALHDPAQNDDVAKAQQQSREQRWSDAPARARELAAEMPWGANYTMAERAGTGGVKAVETGLKRDLAADESEEDYDEDDDGDDEDEDGEDDEDEKMDIDDKKTEGDAAQAAVPKGPMLPLEDVLRFMSTGVLVPRRQGGMMVR